MSKYDFKVGDLVQRADGSKTGKVVWVDTRMAAIQRKNRTVFHVPQNLEVEFVGEKGSRTINGPEQVMALHRLDAELISAAQGMAAPPEEKEGTSRSRKRAARKRGASTGRVPPATSEREATGGD